MFRNRLEKNAKKLKPWSRRHRIEAYRLYDRDIPEFPCIIDVYGKYFVVYDRSDARIERDRERLPVALAALQEAFAVDRRSIFLKARERQKGETQYEKMESSGHEFDVREGEALFRVNLSDYLDTGLFLDHRLMRERVRGGSAGKRVLNLFSYTGSVSVAAALGGAARVTSVDLSATYTEWARENFRLNGLPLVRHDFVQANALEFLREPRAPLYDLVFLDPPTFSNSKRMSGDFEVERDQDSLVGLCMPWLAPGGQLWFSCNKRTFRLSAAILAGYSVRDVTGDTIPFDFRDRKIHCAFEIGVLDGAAGF